MTLQEQRAISAIRFLAADGVQNANSGHPGLAIGAAPMAFTLWKKMKHNPKDPKWQARDRFVLSSGHASMLEYSLLHLFGYDLPMEEIKRFRQYGSLTPGHPEYGHTVGVEATTGPLGQGFCMAVGMAMAESHLAAIFNREGFPVVDNYTYTIMGDGCMMEGAQAEAASMAGTMKLNKLIALYDSNRITIEGDTDIAFTEDVAARYRAYGWDVAEVMDGEDTDAISAAIDAAKETDMPSLIIVHTKIAHGTLKEGKASSHGEPLGAETIAAMRESYGWEAPAFEIPADVAETYAAMLPGFAAQQAAYEAMWAEYEKAYPELALLWKQYHEEGLPVDFFSDESFFANAEKPVATRASSGEVLNALNKKLPNLFGGSADLAPSNKTELKGEGFYSPENRAGKNIHFGVREFAMACAMNGVALYGGLRPYCATFMVFSDYVKPAVRLSALMGLNVLYVMTHDSIGVGEDGPTHEPIEQLTAMRATPNVNVFRPADRRETAYCYAAALSENRPAMLAFTRQNLPQYEETGAGALKGAYIVKDCAGMPEIILMASGSELQCAMEAADALAAEGVAVRVVSVPCMELFERTDAAYRESVLPAACRKRIAVEAGATMSWYRYTGLDGKVVGLDRFGASAPYSVLFKELGINAETVLAVAKEMLAE